MIHSFSQNALKIFPFSLLFRSCFGVAFFKFAQIVEINRSIYISPNLGSFQTLFLQILFRFHFGSPPLLGYSILDLFCHFCTGHWGSVHFFPQSLLSLLCRPGKFTYALSPQLYYWAYPASFKIFISVFFSHNLHLVCLWYLLFSHHTF